MIIAYQHHDYRRNLSGLRCNKKRTSTSEGDSTLFRLYPSINDYNACPIFRLFIDDYFTKVFQQAWVLWKFADCWALLEFCGNSLTAGPFLSFVEIRWLGPSWVLWKFADCWALLVFCGNSLTGPFLSFVEIRWQGPSSFQG